MYGEPKYHFWLKNRIRNLLAEYAIDVPISEIRHDDLNDPNSEHLWEVHSAHSRKLLESVGFKFVREGYFSSIYRLPTALLYPKC